MIVCFSTITVQIAQSINYTLLFHKLIIDNILTKSFFKSCFCEIWKPFSMSFYRLQLIVFLLNIIRNCSGTVNIELHTPLRCILYNFHCSYKVSSATKISCRRQLGRMGKGVVFATTLIELSGFNPHPGHVVASLDKTLYDDYLCLVASNKQQIQWTRIQRNPLEHWIIGSS